MTGGCGEKEDTGKAQTVLGAAGAKNGEPIPDVYHISQLW